LEKKTDLFSINQMQNLPPTATFTPMSNAVKLEVLSEGCLSSVFSGVTHTIPGIRPAGQLKLFKLCSCKVCPKHQLW
jgi:hypothetical protein